MVLEYIKRAWEAYRKNMINLVIAEILCLVMVGVFSLIGIGIVFNYIGISSLKDLFSLELFIRKIVLIIPLLFQLFLASIFFFLAGIILVFTNAGLYGVAVESLRGRIKASMMFQFMKKFGLRAIISSLIVGLIASVFLILCIVLNALFPFFGAMIGFLIFFLITITFSLVFPAIVIDDLNSIKAIKESFSISKRNYSKILTLWLFYIVMSLVVLIPFAGIFVWLFFIIPMMRISLVFFYIRNK
jgi:hypothetical protein